MAPRIHVLNPGEQATLPEGYQFTTPEALALAELYLIKADLTGSLHNIQALQELDPYVQADQKANATAEALYRDAVVQFIACFDGVNRLSVEEVYGDVEGGMETMQYLRDLRDTYAAHRFGPNRQCVIAILPVEGGYWFTGHTFTYCLPHQDKLPVYAHYIEGALALTQDKIDRLTATVGRQLAALSNDEIERLPPLSVKAPRWEDFRLTRDGFRSGRKPRQQGPSGRGGGRP